MRNFTGNGNVILDLFLEMFEKLGVKTSYDMIILKSILLLDNLIQTSKNTFT
jgi:hypothetical protein